MVQALIGPIQSVSGCSSMDSMLQGISNNLLIYNIAKRKSCYSIIPASHPRQFPSVSFSLASSSFNSTNLDQTRISSSPPSLVHLIVSSGHFLSPSKSLQVLL